MGPPSDRVARALRDARELVDAARSIRDLSRRLRARAHRLRVHPGDPIEDPDDPIGWYGPILPEIAGRDDP